MNSSKRDSRPICKRKENCPGYKEGSCQYSHPICKFGNKCNKPDCIFTHDPTKYQHKSPFKSPVSKQVCKFGLKCNKVREGKCPFLHEDKKNPQEKVECHFGDKCRYYESGKCKNYHPPKANKIQETNSFVENKQERKLSKNYSYDTEEVCHDYIFNVCPDQQCEKKHCFVKDNSLKRIFYSTKYPLSQTSECGIIKMNARVVYTFKNLTAINFFSIDEKTKLLRNVSDHELYEKDNITKFFVDKKIIFYTLGRNVLCIYKFLNGTIDRIQGNFDNIISVSTINENHYLVATDKGVIIFKNGEPDNQNMEKINKEMREKFLENVNFCTKSTILGETIFMIGFRQGGVIFINSNLECKTEVFREYNVLDGCAFVYDHHPFALVSTMKEQTSEVFYTDLVSFKSVPVFTYKNVDSSINRYVSKIRCVYDKVFLSIDSIGVMVYKLPNFKERLGTIIIPGKIKEICVEEDGNLIVLEDINLDEAGSLSIFKVRND